LQQSLFFGVLDDVPPGAVFHRSTGVHELGLAENMTTGLLRQSPEPDQGRIPDGLDQSVAYVHCLLHPARERDLVTEALIIAQAGLVVTASRARIAASGWISLPALVC
jgi:hypothetical protein